MSYARFGPTSDVYVYAASRALTPRPYLCCGCKLLSGPGEHAEAAIDGMLAHLGEHREAGDRVPQEAFDLLRDEQRAVIG